MKTIIRDIIDNRKIGLFKNAKIITMEREKELAYIDYFKNEEIIFRRKPITVFSLYQMNKRDDGKKLKEEMKRLLNYLKKYRPEFISAFSYIEAGEGIRKKHTLLSRLVSLFSCKYGDKLKRKEYQYIIKITSYYYEQVD